MNKIALENELVALQGNMRNFALSLTLDVNTAEDLMQDTTLKVLDNRDKYTDDVNFKGWVLTIMKNIFINNYRRIIRNQTVIDISEDLYRLNLSPNTEYYNTEGRYYFGEISKTIDSFTDEYRVPFSMHIQGYKYDEISSRLQLPLGTVKSRIFLARKRLQEKFRDYQ